MRYNLRIREREIKYKSFQYSAQVKSVKKNFKNPVKEIKGLKSDLEFKFVKSLKSRGKTPKRFVSLDITTRLAEYLTQKYNIGRKKYEYNQRFYEDFGLNYKR